MIFWSQIFTIRWCLICFQIYDFFILMFNLLKKRNSHLYWVIMHLVFVWSNCKLRKLSLMLSFRILRCFTITRPIFMIFFITIIFVKTIFMDITKTSKTGTLVISILFKIEIYTSEWSSCQFLFLLR